MRCAKQQLSLETSYLALWSTSPNQSPSYWPPLCSCVEDWWGCACLTHEPRSWCKRKKAIHPVFLSPALRQHSWLTQGFWFFRSRKVVKYQNQWLLLWLKFRCITSCPLNVILHRFFSMHCYPSQLWSCCLPKISGSIFKCPSQPGLPELLGTEGLEAKKRTVLP